MALRDRNTGKANVIANLIDNARTRMSVLRAELTDLWDSAVNRTTDAGVLYGVPKTLAPRTIAAGSTEVVHGVGYQPKQVSFKDADGWNLEVQWRVKVGAESTTIEVYTLEEYENVTINLNCWI